MKENDYSLIIVSDQSPCLDLNHPLIEGDWKDTFMQDFEIYYDVNKSFLKLISNQTCFPYGLLMDEFSVLAEWHGLKDDYSFILDHLSSSIHER